MLQKDAINSLTFLRLHESHQTTLDELHVSMQWLPRAITDTNGHELELPEYRATMINFQIILTRMIGPCALITFGTKYLNKLTYTMVNRVLNNLHILLNFWFLIVIHIVRVSIFSIICTDGLHNLGKDATQGHPTTSVYTEATSIRNNLFGILIPKTTVFGQSLSLLK